MFRLAQCQLDEISKLRKDGAVKAALETLPKTLEASYSRILGRIDPNDDTFARQVLLWLVHAFYPLHLPAIAEAAVFKPGMSAIEDEARLGDPGEVLDICGMLVFHNDNLNEIRKVHHTVRDYLLAVEDSFFYLPEKNSHRSLAELCCRTCLWIRSLGHSRVVKSFC
ncbi:hypothetical protein K431DRAFT_44733 [Polychaeton citri CBS 116435]|uniref:GPI inositol-deacylase winged helix domain-containing protein n=1 Tax=Polychaeton citri CBS 116435 TaxID=1314669 RepID=A0A9P4UQ59_9PEZI|nr:hypothetical protein K431DRAFT_44733 [Polychaeton citri CBS 116435]